MSGELKRWKHRGKPLLIPADNHESGKVRGYREGWAAKGSKNGSSSPGGRGRRDRSTYWPVGRWADGSIYGGKKR
jgi:hypothetical protein